MTPEATDSQKPSLINVGDRLALLYWDRSGREAGVRARWLDADGRIAGASSAVGALRGGHFWPAIDKTPDGFVVVWQDDRDHENADLFFRKLNAELEPQGNEVRSRTTRVLRSRRPRRSACRASPSRRTPSSSRTSSSATLVPILGTSSSACASRSTT